MLTVMLVPVNSLQDVGYFDGLFDGYNISQYLVSTGRLGRADVSRQGRAFFGGRPKRRAFSLGLFGIPDGTTLRVRLL